jgi:hypothetical protein
MSTHLSPLKRPKELQTRFLYPFTFHSRKVNEACEALGRLTFPTRKGETLTVWNSARPHALYEEDMSESVINFLFRNSDTFRCAYLRISDRVTNLWFNKTEIFWSNKTSCPVRLVSSVSIELFLTWYGVGLLSVSLRPAQEELDLNSVKEFNYKLSQLRPQTAALLRVRHPAENSRFWSQLPDEQKKHIPASPDPTEQLVLRLGKGGGTFLLSELIEEQLLHPLKELGLQGIQNQLAVYTVVRFGEDVDFGVQETCDCLAPFLAGLSQIEEPTHAGHPASAPAVNHVILNSRHWAGIGLLAASHLVADQALPELAFNEARVPRVFLKYFVPYLVAFLQRAILQGFLNEASELDLSSTPDETKSSVALWRQLLDFSNNGYFTSISLREPIQRYFDKCQESFKIREARDNALQLFEDIMARQREHEARLRSEVANVRAERQLRLIETMSENVQATKLLTEQQVQLAQALSNNASATNRLQTEMASHLDTLAGIQMKVEWIEIFVVGFYTAELAHLIISLFEKHYEFELWWSTALVLGAGFLAGFITWLMLRPGHRAGFSTGKTVQHDEELLTSRDEG